nr:uncharacterized protein LOC129272416 [Lytechinus pictus]
MSMKTTPHQQPLEPHRGRTNTDGTPNRPGISRARKGAPITAPGSVEGIFRAELGKVIEKRANQVDSIDEDGDGNQVCCRLHHIEAAAANDDGQDTYENVHHVRNLNDFRRQQQTSKQALKKNQELYQDFHETKTLQEQLGQPEDVYETPVSFPNFVPTCRTENRLSGFSTSSEESEGGDSAMSAPRSLHSNKEPVESSWPSTPVPSDESEPEYPAEPTNIKISKAESRKESILCPKEPEASLCLDEHDEPIYVNAFPLQRKPGTVISRTPTLGRTPRENACKPNVPERSMKKNQVPPKLPKRNLAKITQEIKDKCRKLKDEKLAGLAEVRVAKTTLVRNLQMLCLKKINDCILITYVPDELKDHFCTGDQWLKVNDTNLNSVYFAETCVQMSDKPEIEITVRRIPFGTICDFPWTSRREADIGLKIQGNEIELVQRDGLAHQRGSLQSNDTTCMNTAGLRCNYVITEINFDPVHPDASTEQVWDTIKKTPGIVVLILHPVDFRTVQRGYGYDDDGLYQNSN